MRLPTSTLQPERKKKYRSIGRIEHVIVNSIAPGMSVTLSTHPKHVWMEPIEFGYGALRKHAGLRKKWMVMVCENLKYCFSTFLLILI